MKKLDLFISRHAHLLSIVCPVLIGLIYIVLCCLNINGSTWFDESYTSYLTRGDFADIWRLTSVDVHPPLYYFAVKLWSLIFGHSLVTLRLLSTFFGLISIIIAFHLVKRHFGVKPAIISTLILGLSPTLVRYGQEMRMYTMVVAIVLAATYILDLTLSAQKSSLQKSAAQTDLKTNPKTTLTKSPFRLWALYALIICLGMWTHYFSAFAWLAHLVYILYSFGVFQKSGLKTFWNNKPLRNNILKTYALAVSLFLPWVPFFFIQSATVQGGFWINDMSLKTLADFFSETFLYTSSDNLTNWPLILLVLAIALIIFLALRTLKPAPKDIKNKYFSLLFLAFVPLGLLTLLSMPPFSPIFIPRYITYSAIALWLIVGVLLATAPFPKKAPKNLVNILSIFAVSGLLLVGLTNVTNREPNDYLPDIITPVQELSSRNEPILMTSAWNYYNAVVYTTDEHPVSLYSEWIEADWGSYEPIRDYKLNVYDDLSDFTDKNDRFWVITSADKPIDADNPLFKNYYIKGTIIDSHYHAYEFEKLPDTKLGLNEKV